MTVRPGALSYQPNLWSDESIVGSYQIRLREANRIPTMEGLASVLGAQPQFVGPQRLYTDSDGIQLLEVASTHTFRLADAMPKALQGASGPVLRWEKGALSIQFWMTSRAQVCTECLREQGYLDNSLDFWHLPVCAEHECLLTDFCANCGSALSLNRQALCHCQNCGSDLRDMSAAHVPREVSDLTRRLADLRSIPLAQGERRLVELSANEVAAFVAFFASGEYIEQEATRLPASLTDLNAQARLKGLKSLAGCENGGAFDVDVLRAQLLQRARYMAPFRATALFEYWLHSSSPPVQLGLLAANALLFGHASDTAHLAAHRGLVERIRSVDQLGAVLGTDVCTAQTVAAASGLARTRTDLAYDADVVLAAKRYFDASLPFRELDECFGTAGLTERLLSHLKLGRLSTRGDGEGRITADSIVTLLKTLDSGVVSEVVPRGRVLGQFGPREQGDIVAQVLSGAVQATHWPPPYRLCDLAVNA